MKELFYFAITGANIIPTALLFVVVVYWVTVLLGLVDLDMFDLDLDMDADGSGVEWLSNSLRFFNLGRIPLMVFLTFLVLPLWWFCIVVNDLLGFESFLPGLLTLGAGFWVCMFIAKVLTIPFVKLFEKMEQEKNVSIIGKICTLQSSLHEGRIGQAFVEQKGNGAPLILMVCSKPGTTVQNGETALVLEYQPDKRCYLVEPYLI